MLRIETPKLSWLKCFFFPGDLAFQIKWKKKKKKTQDSYGIHYFFSSFVLS